MQGCPVMRLSSMHAYSGQKCCHLHLRTMTNGQFRFRLKPTASCQVGVAMCGTSQLDVDVCPAALILNGLRRGLLCSVPKGLLGHQAEVHGHNPVLQDRQGALLRLVCMRLTHAAVSACTCMPAADCVFEARFATCSSTSCTRTMPRSALTCSAGR
jgi:hypothetical protein